MATLKLKRPVVKVRGRASTCQAPTLNGLVVTHERFVEIFQRGKRKRVVCTTKGRRGIPLWKGEPI